MLIFPLIFSLNLAIAQNPGLEVEGNGILLPRLSSAERDAISIPETGLMIFNTSKNCLELYSGNDWFSLCNQDKPSPNTLLGGSDHDGISCIQQTSDGGYVFAGGSSSSSSGDVSDINHGSTDFWIVKTDEFFHITWNKLLGGLDSESASCMQQTSDGGYIVAGTSSSSSASGDVTGVNHGGQDYWIIKLDGSGNILWEKLLGGIANEQVRAIQQTTDGGYIVAGFSTSNMNGDVSNPNHGQADYWIVKLNGSGNIVWNKLLGGDNQEVALSIQQTTDGGFIVAGYSGSSANGDVSGVTNGVDDIWIVKLNALGNIVWEKLIGGNSSDFATSIVQTSDGGYVVASWTNSSVSGDVTGVNHGFTDFWIIKLNSTGKITWEKLLGGDGNEYALKIKQTTDGGYIVAGYSDSSSNGDVTNGNHGIEDYWIVKLFSIGKRVWNRLYGGSDSDQAVDVCPTSDGGYIIAGSSISSSNGDVSGANHGLSDCWIIKINASGNIIK